MTDLCQEKLCETVSDINLSEEEENKLITPMLNVMFQRLKSGEEKTYSEDEVREMLK